MILRLFKKHKTRWVLLYFLPITLFAGAFYFDFINLSGKDFLIPALWGLWMPWFNGQNSLFKNNTKFIFRSFNEKPYVPFGISILHGTIWSIAVHLFDLSIFRILFFAGFFFIYDFFLLKHKILQIFSLPLKIMQSNVLTKLLSFGVIWWGYLSIGLVLIQIYVADTPFNIMLFTLVLIVPIQLFLLFFQYRKPISLNIKKVAVIGAGWNGIYAAKWLKESGIDVKVFEKNESQGGIWKFDNNRKVGVSERAYASSSKNYLHASDFAMPKEYVYFPHRSEVLNFMGAYIEKNELSEKIHYDTSVEKAFKKGDKWIVTGHKNGQPFTEEFDAIVGAAGANQKAKPVGFESKYQHFTGKVIHSSEYKNTDCLEGYERIAVIGLGESGADIAHECADARGKKVYWGGSDSQWFAGKLIGGNSAADEFMVPGIRAMLSNFLMFEDLGRAYVGKIIGFVWGIGGTGVKEWEPKYTWMMDFVTKSMHAIFDVHDGKITPFGKINKLESDSIYCEDGKKLAVDLIIDCSGYVPNYPFLEQGFNIWNTYDMVFDLNDPTLSFVGTARPILGSIPGLGELQARWMASVYSGRTALPNKEQQVIEAYYNKETHACRFPNSAKRPTLVDHEFYATKLADKMRIAVPWLYLFFFRFPLFRLLLNAPWMPFKYNIKEEHSREKAIENIKLNMPSKTVPFYKFISTFKLHAVYLFVVASILGLGIVLYIPLYIIATVFSVWMLKNIIDFFIDKYSFVPPNGVLTPSKIGWLEKISAIRRNGFILFTALIAIGSVFTMYLLYLGYGGMRELTIFLVFYLISTIGIEIGFHRYFTHQAFKANKLLQALLALFGGIAGAGTITFWVAMHKMHHKNADDENDPHSPVFDKTKKKSRLMKFLHAHFLWVYSAERNIKNTGWINNVKRLTQNPIVVFFDSTHILWLLLGIILPALINGIITQSWMGALLGFLWGGLLRLFIVGNFSWLINSLCHVIGSRPFKDQTNNSRNNILLALPTLGQSYHNNHHAFPASANLGLKWWQFDPGFWIISFFKFLGWASDINKPKEEDIRMRMR
jgi:stearoyl-CoA desaturase (delta-9 desaturase)